MSGENACEKRGVAINADPTIVRNSFPLRDRQFSRARTRIIRQRGFLEGIACRPAVVVSAVQSILTRLVLHRLSRMAHPICQAKVSTLAQKNGNAAVKVGSSGEESKTNLLITTSHLIS